MPTLKDRLRSCCHNSRSVENAKISSTAAMSGRVGGQINGWPPNGRIADEADLICLSAIRHVRTPDDCPRANLGWPTSV